MPRKPKPMKVEMRLTSEVKAYQLNPRIRDEKNVEGIAESIRAYGFQQPIVVDKRGVVIAGHGRLLAAEFLKLDEVPVVVAAHLTREQARAYRIADNRAAETSGWDMSVLPLELGDLHRSGFDLGLTLFDMPDLEKMVPGLRDGPDPDPPGEFPEVDGDIETEHRCPKCGYEWSGKPS